MFRPPILLPQIEAATQAAGFRMASEPPTGSLLRTLAASKPGGRMLEMGTGTGMGTAWLLDGMDAAARLTTVDRDERNSGLARQFLGGDPRVTFHLGDGGEFLQARHAEGARFDLIFADTWPGKFAHLDTTLDLLAPGGLYVVDDLAAQAAWLPDHARNVEEFLAGIRARPDLTITQLDWHSGLLVAARGRPG